MGRCYGCAACLKPTSDNYAISSHVHDRHKFAPEQSSIVHPSFCVSGRKSCAITTARRLGEFLGDERIKVR